METVGYGYTCYSDTVCNAVEKRT